MNARLKKLKDGSGAIHRNEVVWFDVMGGDQTTRKESGTISTSRGNCGED